MRSTLPQTPFSFISGSVLSYVLVAYGMWRLLSSFLYVYPRYHYFRISPLLCRLYSTQLKKVFSSHLSSNIISFFSQNVTFTQKKSFALSLFLISWILYFFIITGHDGCGRYRLLCEPILLVMSSFTGEALVQRLRKIIAQPLGT